MKNFSLTASGIILAVGGTLLTQWFSESCTDEILKNAPLFLGAVVAWIGRVRAGGMDVLGFKK